ncbi:MAG: hypothetical protein U9O94_06120 [Nanoarchaeota archaeon]|nr:hypothetical protein [Nanoarchaeota archaeon]
MLSIMKHLNITKELQDNASVLQRLLENDRRSQREITSLENNIQILSKQNIKLCEELAFLKHRMQGLEDYKQVKKLAYMKLYGSQKEESFETFKHD